MGAVTGLAGVTLRRSTTAQQLADLLSDQIMAGAFSAGDRLRESAIATQLGVSRNTVREAVRVLELGGLVRYEVNRGAVIISPTQQSLDEVYTARERLETAAAARAPRPDQVRAIRAAYESLVETTQSRQAHQIVEADLAFHTSIVAILDSARLSRFYADLTQELRFYLMVLSVEDREYDNPEALLLEHEVILDAIESGDRASAVQAVHSHVEHNSARVKEILTARSGDQ